MGRESQGRANGMGLITQTNVVGFRLHTTDSLLLLLLPPPLLTILLLIVERKEEEEEEEEENVCKLLSQVSEWATSRINGIRRSLGRARARGK